MEELKNEPVSVGNWIITYIIMCIPIVNIIMMFVWAFGGGAPKSKSNWAKAFLLMFAISFVIYLILFAVVGVGAMAASSVAPQ